MNNCNFCLVTLTSLLWFVIVLLLHFVRQWMSVCVTSSEFHYSLLYGTHKTFKTKHIRIFLLYANKSILKQQHLLSLLWLLPRSCCNNCEAMLSPMARLMERLPNLGWLKDDLILDGIFNWVITILKIIVTQLFNLKWKVEKQWFLKKTLRMGSNWKCLLRLSHLWHDISCWNISNIDFRSEQNIQI